MYAAHQEESRGPFFSKTQQSTLVDRQELDLIWLFNWEVNICRGSGACGLRERMTTCWVYPDRCMTHVFYLNFKLVPRLQYPDETRKFSCFFFSLGILIWCNSGSGLALLSLSLSLSLISFHSARSSWWLVSPVWFSFWSAQAGA